jgi:hypothetical protein
MVAAWAGAPVLPAWTAATTPAWTMVCGVLPVRAASVCTARPMVWAAVAGLVAPAASWVTSEVANAFEPAAVPAAVARADRSPSRNRTSLPPAITVTSSVPLNLPPAFFRWLAIWVTTGTVIRPSVGFQRRLFGPTGLVTREPPWA